MLIRKEGDNMAGVKTFINNTDASFQVILFIRAGENPVNQDGVEIFTLAPGETREVTFGDANNSFLNGISLFTIANGDLFSSVQFVTVESSLLDNLLNTNDTLTITQEQTNYVITGSNTPPPEI